MALGSERIMPRKDRKIVTPSFCHTHNISVFAQPSRGTTCGMTTNMQADVMENSVCDEAANQRELKKQWRAHAIARRKQTSKEERLEAGRKLAEQARKANLIHSFTTVAAFASMGSEMSMMPMLQALFDSNCHVLVPRLGSGMDIGWSELGDIHDLQDQTNSDGSINMHRPQEPGNSANGPEALKNAGLIIVPALAVDQEGFRLGRGGGWYDRALEYRAAGARVVAVCWPWEPTDKPVPHEDHDIPVDGVLTPNGFTAIRE